MPMPVSRMRITTLLLPFRQGVKMLIGASDVVKRGAEAGPRSTFSATGRVADADTAKSKASGSALKRMMTRWLFRLRLHQRHLLGTRLAEAIVEENS